MLIINQLQNSARLITSVINLNSLSILSSAHSSVDSLNCFQNFHNVKTLTKSFLLTPMQNHHVYW